MIFHTNIHNNNRVLDNQKCVIRKRLIFFKNFRNRIKNTSINDCGHT